MKVKRKFYAGKMLLLLMLACTTIFTFSTRKANAQQTRLYIAPASVTISQPGENATVEVYLADVANIYAYEFKIFYLNSVVNATAAVRPPGHFMEPSDPTLQFIPKWEIKNNFNATHGRIWLGFTLLAPEAPKSGSGILVRITFLGIAEGSTALYFKDTKLADGTTGAPIPHTAENGEITVIPEFPVTATTMSILFIITAAYAAQKLMHKRKTKI